jgi:hypothetical protein
MKWSKVTDEIEQRLAEDAHLASAREQAEKEAQRVHIRKQIMSRQSLYVPKEGNECGDHTIKVTSTVKTDPENLYKSDMVIDAVLSWKGDKSWD